MKKELLGLISIFALALLPACHKDNGYHKKSSKKQVKRVKTEKMGNNGRIRTTEQHYKETMKPRPSNH